MPFSAKGFIAESLDEPQPKRTGDPSDVFPLLISLQNLKWRGVELLLRSPVLLDPPHDPV